MRSSRWKDSRVNDANSLARRPVFAATMYSVALSGPDSRWTPERERMDQWIAWSGRPLLVTEWHVKGVDSGMKNSSGAGWVVKTQADRGRFYQHFALGLLEDPGCVGWHWHRYQDNSDRREGGSSNKGLVNLTYQPHGPLRDAMEEFNAQVYPLIRARQRR